MKMHLNFGTRDLAKSVTFYRTLLAAEPAKHFSDYALFVVDEPGLELALDAGLDRAVGHDAHYGVVVNSEDTVAATAKRLADAGFATDVEVDQTCCYARQSKVWTSDPDGRRWETYFVHEETAERDDPACCSEEQTCCREEASV